MLWIRGGASHLAPERLVRTLVTPFTATTRELPSWTMRADVLITCLKPQSPLQGNESRSALLSNFTETGPRGQRSRESLDGRHAEEAREIDHSVRFVLA